MDYVFVDFDGTLHSYKSKSFNCEFAPNLKLITCFWPNVKFVFSTSWGEYQTFEQLLKYIPPDLHLYFVGKTTIVREEIKFPRSHEIAEWFKHQNIDQDSVKWVAIDDCETIFNPDCKNLFLVDGLTGFNATEAVKFCATFSDIKLI